MDRALLLIAVVAPLPFGGNRPWAWVLVALATGALLVLWAWRLWRAGAPPVAAGHRVRGPALLFLLVCAYVAFKRRQGLPTPTGGCRQTRPTRRQRKFCMTWERVGQRPMRQATQKCVALSDRIGRAEQVCVEKVL